MNEDLRFWWSWWVNVAIAVGTVGAVLVALFGERVRGWLFKPRLVLTVPNPQGERQPVQLRAPTGEVRTEEARFYHLRVTNSARWPKATEVQVFLTRIEDPGPDGDLQLRWATEVPVKWKFQEIQPLSRTVGPHADCDLCSVVKNKWVQLHPLIVPNNLTEFARRRERFDMVLSFEARSAEASSSPKRIKISWDGQWHDGESEMAKHLVIRELN